MGCCSWRAVSQFTIRKMNSIYTTGQATDFILKVFGEGKTSNGGLNISVVCPICRSQKPSSYNKKKLVIRTDNFVSHCWVCNYKSKNIFSLIKKWNSKFLNEYINVFMNGQQLSDLENESEKEELEPKELKLPYGYRMLALEEDNDIDVKKAKRYLNSRGISSQKDLWYWKFGISTEDEDLEERVIIPSFDASGKLNYWTGRSFWKKPKYLNPEINRTSVIFNEINIDWSKPLTLVEGPFDLLKCNENATCMLGSELTTEYLLFQKIVEHQTPIVLALDDDAKHKALKIAKNLSEFDIKITLLSVPKEKGDVGAMTKSEFNDLYLTGIEFNSSTYLLQKIRLITGDR